MVALAINRYLRVLVGGVLCLGIFGGEARVEAQHIPLTVTQRQYRDLYSTVVGISAHKVIERYLRDQYLHVPPYSPGPRSPLPRAEAVMMEKTVPQANVAFKFPLPTKPGKGGRLDFAAKYWLVDGKCYWEVHEIKPAGWHYGGLGQAAMAQMTSYMNGIKWDQSGAFQGCTARPAERWSEGQPGWHTIPPSYTGLYDTYNVKLQVQTWYRTEPGIVYYRFVWKDRNSRRKALREGLSQNLAELVNKIAHNELPLSNRYVLGELVPWMWALRNEDREVGSTWEDKDGLQELIDIKLSLDDTGTWADEDENDDVSDCSASGKCGPPRQRNAVDMSVTTMEMVEYWEAWSTPDPWYFKDWAKVMQKPLIALPDGVICRWTGDGTAQPYVCGL